MFYGVVIDINSSTFKGVRNILSESEPSKKFVGLRSGGIDDMLNRRDNLC